MSSSNKQKLMGNINFHHYGLALKDFNNAIKLYAILGYQCSEKIYDSLQNVELILCSSEKYLTVEFVKSINDKLSVFNYFIKKNEKICHTFLTRY